MLREDMIEWILEEHPSKLARGWSSKCAAFSYESDGFLVYLLRDSTHYVMEYIGKNTQELNEIVDFANAELLEKETIIVAYQCVVCKTIIEGDEYICDMCQLTKCGECYSSYNDNSFYCNGCKLMWCEECALTTKPMEDCGFCLHCENTLTVDEMHRALQ
jgi:hypothetical protein